MAINKVVYGNNVLVDLTNDTVSPENLQSGATAHSKSGNLIRGTANMGGAAPCTVMLAPEFSTSQDYSVGEYVIYSGVLYRFLVNHSAGAWNSGQAKQVYMSGDVKRNNDGMIIYPFLMEAGRYINKDHGGNTSFPSGPYSASTWIPICSSKLHVRIGCSTDAAGYAFYDEHKVYISGGKCPGSSSAVAEATIDVPENARFFRFSNMTSLVSSSLYVKGYLDRDIPYFDHIPWESKIAFSVVDGAIVRSISSETKGTMALIPRSLESLFVKPYDFSGWCYRNIYDKNNVCVGSIRSDGYHDRTGAKVEGTINYYSFTETVSGSFSYFIEQESYIQMQTARHIRKNVSTVAELEAALLQAAEFATPYRVYDIYIASGTYDLWNGIDHTRISGNGDNAYKRGLEIPSYCNLWGIGDVVLDLTIPSNQRSYSTVISCLNTHCVEATIHNITLTTYDGRYCVHDDSYPNLTSDHTILWENCVFEYRGRPDTTYTIAAHCYGAGFYSGAKAIFKNCIFKCGNDAQSLNWTGVAIHGHASSSSSPQKYVNKPFYGEIENCAFLAANKTAVLPHAVTDSSIIPQYEFSINNCYFASGSIINLKGVGGNNLFGGGNSPVTIQQDNTNNVYLVQPS